MAGTGELHRNQGLIDLMRTINCLLTFLIICSWATLAEAASTAITPFQDENIHINADRMDQSISDEMYIAEGNVVVLWKGMHLVANKVRYAAATHMMYANGAVVLSKDATVLKGEALVMDMDTGRAEINPALLAMPESNMTLAAEKLVRIDENRFSTSATELTTCDMPEPAWKFGASTLNVNTQDYATGKNVIFYIKDIPVLYIPWFAYPIVTEKKSGLLFPHFGYSKKRGGQLDIPAYWVISPSQDFQFDLDVLSERGIGTGGQYRYIRKRGSEGHLGGYQIYDNLTNSWRWELAQEHKEIFSNDANLRMSVNATSDRTFYSDFGEKSGDYNRQLVDSIVNVLKSWDDYAVTSYLRYNENLYNANNNATLQTLPSLAVAGVRQAVSSMPLYFDLDVTAENLYSKELPRGQRLTLFPRMTLLPFQNNYFQTTLYAGTHIRGYATDNKGGSLNSQSTDGDILPEAGGRLSTSLSNVYTINLLQLKKIRHELVPEVGYVFVPERDQQRLPFYDYTDRMLHRNMLSLSLTSLLNGKFASGEANEYRDISRIKLSADYAIEGGRRDLLTLVDSQRQWSDLMLESDTWITKQLRITFDSRYNVYESLLSTAVAGVEANDQQGNSVGVGYQMARKEVEYLEGRMSTKLFRPFSFAYTARYSFDRKDFLESVYTTEYRHKCWSVNLAIHQRPHNQSYSVNFNLAGLGGK